MNLISICGFRLFPHALQRTILFLTLLRKIVHWTILSFLFLDKQPAEFYFGHLFKNLLSLKFSFALYVGIPFTTSFNSWIFSPYPYGPLPLPCGYALFVHWRFSNFILRITNIFCCSLSLLYLYYSTNFSFVKGFLKNFFNFFKIFFAQSHKKRRKPL